MGLEVEHTCNHHNQCISIVPIFNHLNQDQMDEIMSKVRSVSFKKGEVIYHSGDESDSLYIVNNGKIKIYRLSETGKEQLLRILSPGDFTGELALFKQSTHEAYAEALVDTTVCIIKRPDLQQFLLKYPSISVRILNEFSNRLEQSEKQTTRFATESVETRIALYLAECVEDEDHYEFTLPMNKKDLASYLGTTPETISRKLTDLETKGLIKQKTHKRIEVKELDGLLLI
ncbi:Crp/Fnr family transcriptional regulator [Alkalibacillus aidingensis]|uniref:Crp/Fnr family transcriptional regulator n=1 Tax=Alkalibacillus aidingensis TaxID=2747607 RepID=UPI0016608A1C|nr:Crp/Fnr family transcriptional regulator [Alkalibacillus aidingensis]